jgi:hypothetical protein
MNTFTKTKTRIKNKYNHYKRLYRYTEATYEAKAVVEKIKAGGYVDLKIDI